MATGVPAKHELGSEEIVMDLLSNPWVVGIGGGIISGVIVTLVTRLLFSRGDSREYMQNVSAVNREVVYALRPGISEGGLPSEDVLSSLVNATARKYRVNSTDTFSSKQIAEELIKEIMDSTFISAETKRNYCETLAQLASEPKGRAEPQEESSDKDLAAKEYRQRMVMQMSLMLGFMAAMMTMATVLLPGLTGNRDTILPFQSSDITTTLLSTAAILIAIVGSMAAAKLTVRLKTSREDGTERRTRNESSENK